RRRRGAAAARGARAARSIDVPEGAQAPLGLRVVRPPRRRTAGVVEPEVEPAAGGAAREEAGPLGGQEVGGSEGQAGVGPARPDADAPGRERPAVERRLDRQDAAEVPLDAEALGERLGDEL